MQGVPRLAHLMDEGRATLDMVSLVKRNMSLGVALGEGRTLKEVLGERKEVTEGVAAG